LQPVDATITGTPFTHDRAVSAHYATGVASVGRVVATVATTIPTMVARTKWLQRQSPQ